MTVNIVTTALHKSKCDRCGKTESHGDLSYIKQVAEEHEDFHLASRSFGRRFGDKVLDGNAHKEPWFGIIFKAAEYAAAQGIPYISWNWYVYSSVGLDMENPLAFSADIPGNRDYKS